MLNIRRYSNQPNHQRLIAKAVEILTKDRRVKGLYLSGSPKTDEYSDIDLMILSSEEDRQSLEKDRLKIATQVGEIKAEAMSPGVPHTYVVFYHPEEIKFDYCFHTFPEKSRPDRANIDILYDPNGHLKELVREAAKEAWTIDLEELDNRIKHFYVGIGYTIPKIAREELWESRDCIEWYRKALITFEDILAKRKREGYRKLERKLQVKRLELLEQTIPTDLTKEEIFRSLDNIFGYFDSFLKKRLLEMNVFPEEYATKMKEYYNRKKGEILKGASL